MLSKELLVKVLSENNWGVYLKSSPLEEMSTTNVGMIYNPTIDGFIYLQPYSSWTFDSSLGIWKPPLEKPTIENDVIGGPYYEWNESLYQSDNTKGWVLITP